MWNKIGIIGALEAEVELLKERMTDVKVTQKVNTEFFEGTLNGKSAVVVRCGVGKVNAAVCTQILVDLFQVDVVINTGIAGSLNARINIGDVIISTDVLHHDMDVTIFGYQKGEVPGLGVLSFPADEALIRAAEKSFNICHEKYREAELKNRAMTGLAGRSSNDGRRGGFAVTRNLYRGRIVSGDQFIENGLKKGEILLQFKAMCTEMEGAAIAQTAWLNEKPFIVIRVISDKADNSAQMDYRTFETYSAHLGADMIWELMALL